MIAGQEPRVERPLSAKPQHGEQDTRIDLERLVWDPEYRKAMRHLLHRKG